MFVSHIQIKKGNLSSSSGHAFTESLSVNKHTELREAAHYSADYYFRPLGASLDSVLYMFCTCRMHWWRQRQHFARSCLLI